LAQMFGPRKTATFRKRMDGCSHDCGPPSGRAGVTGPRPTSDTGNSNPARSTRTRSDRIGSFGLSQKRDGCDPFGTPSSTTWTVIRKPRCRLLESYRKSNKTQLTTPRFRDLPTGQSERRNLSGFADGSGGPGGEGLGRVGGGLLMSPRGRLPTRTTCQKRR
jgi:hypothetical protein